MSKDLMISLLRKGNNGSQILEILDTIVEEDNDNKQFSQTINEIADILFDNTNSPVTVVNYSGESVTI